MSSVKFYLNWRTIYRVISKYCRVRFIQTQTVKSLLLLRKPCSWF